jgi:hypothetical protein
MRLRPSAEIGHLHCMRPITVFMLMLVALLPSSPIAASEPVFLAVLEADSELETAFPGEVIENLWRGAEMRTRRCRAEANDPAWLLRIEEIAASPAIARGVVAEGREYLFHGALANLYIADLDPELLDTFSTRAQRIDPEHAELSSCRGFMSTLQQIYDQPLPGEGTPAVVGTVCGQVELLDACHSQLHEAAARLPD